MILLIVQEVDRTSGAVEQEVMNAQSEWKASRKRTAGIE